MIKRAFFVLFLLFCVTPVLAEDSLEKPPALNRAIGMAAVVDAYNAYCETPSDIGDQLMEKFVTPEMPQAQKDELQEIRGRFYDNTAAKLKKEGKPCDDIDFLLDKLAMTKALKSASNELHGIEEELEEEGALPDLKK